MPFLAEEVFPSAITHQFSVRSNAWSMEVDSLNFAMRLDKEDPLQSFRKLFNYPKRKNIRHGGFGSTDDEDECIYFCGHSLGLQPKNIENEFDEAIKNWAQRAVEFHFHGKYPVADCDTLLKDKMDYLVGAEQNEVAVMNVLTVNVHVLLSSFYNPTPSRHKILMLNNGFPSNLYAVQSYVRHCGYDPNTTIVFMNPKPGTHLINPKDILSFIEREGEDFALIFFEAVHFYTGQLFDMKNIAQTSHNKYLNSGPGSLGAIFVHNKHLKGNQQVMPKMAGWFGTNDKFSISRMFEAVDGADRLRFSNPSPFLVAMLSVSLDIYREAGIERLLEKQRLLTGYMEYLLRKNFYCNSYAESTGVRPIDIITPVNPESRGCQISLLSRVPIDELNNTLIEKGIVCDVRIPSVIRVAPVPLYNTFTEVYQFVHTLREIFDNINVSDDGEK